MADQTRTCRSCGAAMIFAGTRNGRAMPVDRAPAPGGNVRLHNRDGLLEAEVLGPLEQQLAEDEGEQLHWPHHATCPDRDRWKTHG